MKKHNTEKKLKATVAVILVMASLFAISTTVNAILVDLVLGEELTELVPLISSSNKCNHQWSTTDQKGGKCSICKSVTVIQSCGCGEKRAYCTTCSKPLN